MVVGAPVALLQQMVLLPQVATLGTVLSLLTLFIHLMLHFVLCLFPLRTAMGRFLLISHHCGDIISQKLLHHLLQTLIFLSVLPILLLVFFDPRCLETRLEYQVECRRRVLVSKSCAVVLPHHYILLLLLLFLVTQYLLNHLVQLQ